MGPRSRVTWLKVKDVKNVIVSVCNVTSSTSTNGARGLIKVNEVGKWAHINA